MTRIYAADGHLVHDPATGLTHHSPTSLPTGRQLLTEAEVTGWPTLDPGSLDRAMPVSLCWSPIVRCNLHCPQCLDDTSVEELDGHRRAEAAGVLATAHVLGVDISGGEPLLLPDLPDLAGRIAGGGRAAVSITTNGWHLERRIPELAGTVDAIRVSLDGPDADHHDRIRGTGSFQRAAAGIRAAVGSGVAVQIQMVLMVRTQAHAQRMVDLAAALGAGGMTFLQMLPIGAGAALQREMLSDLAVQEIVQGLLFPPGMRVRLRTRAAAGGFTVVRADGLVWRNAADALTIGGRRPLRNAGDLLLTSQDGSA